MQSAAGKPVFPHEHEAVASRPLKGVRHGNQAKRIKPLQKGTGRIFHRNSPDRSAHPGPGTLAGHSRMRNLRARRPFRLAHAPLGQTLIVTSGLGWTQCWGGPVEEIRPGDVLWCPPGVKHWHGASPKTAMTHIAIQEQLNGKNVDWLDKVTDEQYLAGPQNK